jgi:hypothetical protein
MPSATGMDIRFSFVQLGSTRCDEVGTPSLTGELNSAAALASHLELNGFPARIERAGADAQRRAAG